MIPASTVNAKNYHLLGNRLTGESRASRMKRVNAQTPYSPSLIQREPAKMHKINPTKPMNLGTAHAGEMNTRITSMVVGGASSFGLTALFNRYNMGVRKNTVETSVLGALGGFTIGTFSGAMLNNEKIGFARIEGDNSMIDNHVLAGLSFLTPMVFAFVGEGVKNRTKKRRNADLTRALLLGAPGVIASYVSNAGYTVPIYLTSLVGLYAARRYYKI